MRVLSRFSSLLTAESETVDSRQVLLEAAVALSVARCEGDVLRITRQAAERVTGAGASLVTLDAEGRLGRVLEDGSGAAVRAVVALPDILALLVDRLRTVRRPLGPSDLNVAIAAPLRAIAPHGFLVLPLGSEVHALLFLVEPANQPILRPGTVAEVLTLVQLAAAALESLRQSAALRASCDELRRLADQVFSSRDEERRRVAHELHEGVCQRLAAANAHLQALDALLASEATARAQLREGRALVNQTLGELRELAQGMRPSVLESLGYLEALRWYLKRLRERLGIPLSLVVEGAETRLPAPVESALYGATEDALAGAVRRRETQPLRVHYRRAPGAVQVQIAGGRPEASDVIAIRERLRPFGGAVRVSSSPDASTVIEVQVPAVGPVPVN